MAQEVVGLTHYLRNSITGYSTNSPILLVVRQTDVPQEGSKRSREQLVWYFEMWKTWNGNIVS